MSDIDQASISELTERIERLNARVAAMQQAYERLHETQSIYRLLLDESSDPIFAFAPDGTYIYVNNAFAEGVNRPLEAIIAHKIWDVFSPEEAEKRYTVVRWVFEHGETRIIEVRVPRPDGDRYYLTTVKPILDEPGQVSSVICISKEITERKRMEDELRRLSTFDSLTGLYNRNFFEAEVQRLRGENSAPISVLMADVDYLKLTNDTQGHAAGDELIRRAARLLQASLRPDDIIARYGGDEFIVLLRGVGAAGLEQLVEGLRRRIAGEADPGFSLSIGFVASDDVASDGAAGAGAAGAGDLDALIQQADDRMYEEKEARRSKAKA